MLLFGAGQPNGNTIPILTDRVDLSVVLSHDKLNQNYNGPDIAVRRSIDNEETTIGYIGNSLDVSSLLSFSQGSDVYVKRWYDQSGNGRHVEQLTSGFQPKIVSSGSLITGLNGKPAIFFTKESGCFLKTANSFSTPVSGSVFFVGKHDVTMSPDSNAYIFGFYNAVQLAYKSSGTRFQWELYNNAGSTEVTHLYIAPDLVDIWQRARWNNSAKTYTARIKELLGTTTNSSTYVNARGAEVGHLQIGGSNINGVHDYLHEMIILDADCGSTDFLSIEVNIQTRYNA